MKARPPRDVRHTRGIEPPRSGISTQSMIRQPSNRAIYQEYKSKNTDAVQPRRWEPSSLMESYVGCRWSSNRWLDMPRARWRSETQPGGSEYWSSFAGGKAVKALTGWRRQPDADQLMTDVYRRDKHPGSMPSLHPSIFLPDTTTPMHLR